MLYISYWYYLCVCLTGTIKMFLILKFMVFLTINRSYHRVLNIQIRNVQYRPKGFIKWTRLVMWKYWKKWARSSKLHADIITGWERTVINYGYYNSWNMEAQLQTSVWRSVSLKCGVDNKPAWSLGRKRVDRKDQPPHSARLDVRVPILTSQCESVRGRLQINISSTNKISLKWLFHAIEGSQVK